MKVLNLSKEQQTVRIVLASGAKDSINLQPQSRANLPSGAKIDPDYEKVYAPFLKTSEPQTATETQEATSDNEA